MRSFLSEKIGKCLFLQGVWGGGEALGKWRGGGRAVLGHRRHRRDKCEEDFHSLCCGACDRSPFSSPREASIHSTLCRAASG